MLEAGGIGVCLGNGHSRFCPLHWQAAALHQGFAALAADSDMQKKLLKASGV